MIGVTVLASNPMSRARLEALVASCPGLRLIAAPLPLGPTADKAVSVEITADVLVMDPGGRPAEAVLRAFANAPRLPPVVLLAGDGAPPASMRLLRAGVRAILPRDPTVPEIAACIEAVAAGLVVLHPAAAPFAMTKAAGARRTRETGIDPLTPRELEILTMMAEGMGNRAIARNLGISTHTVKFHITAILDKLNARTRTEAVTTGLRLGLLMV